MDTCKHGIQSGSCAWCNNPGGFIVRPPTVKRRLTAEKRQYNRQLIAATNSTASKHNHPYSDQELLNIISLTVAVSRTDIDTICKIAVQFSRRFAAIEWVLRKAHEDQQENYEENQKNRLYNRIKALQIQAGV